jgi:hypothetical protein
VTAQGKSAADIHREFEASWTRADYWLRRSSPVVRPLTR